MTSDGKYWATWWALILGFILSLQCVSSCTKIVVAKINNAAAVEVRK